MKKVEAISNHLGLQHSLLTTTLALAVATISALVFAHHDGKPDEELISSILLLSTLLFIILLWMLFYEETAVVRLANDSASYEVSDFYSNRGAVWVYPRFLFILLFPLAYLCYYFYFMYREGCLFSCWMWDFPYLALLIIDIVCLALILFVRCRWAARIHDRSSRGDQDDIAS